HPPRGFHPPPAAREPRLGALPPAKTIEADRRGKCKISRAPAEFIEAAACIGGETRETRLDQKLIVAQRRCHDALEEIACRDDALAARAFSHHLAVKRHKYEAPFRGRIRMCEAA